MKVVENDEIEREAFTTMSEDEKRIYFLKNYCYRDTLGDYRLKANGELVCLASWMVNDDDYVS